MLGLGRGEERFVMAAQPDHAANVRAARAFAGMHQAELAKKLRLSLSTLRRIEAGQRPVTIEELEQIGQVCEVPPEFMREGFEALLAADAAVELQRRILAEVRKITRTLPPAGSSEAAMRSPGNNDQSRGR